MNESNIPREWWTEQDQDVQWVKQQEDELRQYEEESNQPLFADGFDAALIGIGVQFNQRVAIYDYARCLDVLEKGGLSRDEAIEWMEYNVLGAYVGRRTPVFLTDLMPRKRKPKQKRTIKGQLSFTFDT